MLKKVFSIALLLFALCACEQTPDDNIVPVASVSLNQNEAEMLLGETLQLKAQILPADATDKTLMWGSSKQSVATVSDAGLVTAVGEGSAKITVTASGKTASCAITVTKKTIKVESLELDQSSLSMRKGESVTLTATVHPSDATDANVTWTTADEAVATVDQTGKVTARGAGSTTITAMAGDKIADCTVTVTEGYIPMTAIVLSQTELTIPRGAAVEITATPVPENATGYARDLSWVTSDSEVAYPNLWDDTH